MGWGKYNGYEGPMILGSAPVATAIGPLTRELSVEKKLMAVITATEGGKFDAINMYDRCVLSVGVFQFCEGCGLTTKLLTRIQKVAPESIIGLTTKLAEIKGHPVTFVDGRFYEMGGKPVTTVADKQAFYLGCNGKVGSWKTQQQKDTATAVGKAFSEMLREPRTYTEHLAYCKDMLPMFQMAYARKILFPNGFVQDGYEGAVQALFMSFAANLPLVASNALERIASKPKNTWLVEFARSVVYGSGVAIYPLRYEVIRPIIGKLYGVMPPILSVSPTPPPPMTVKEYQAVLVKLGYDLGPKGADGVPGKKTMAAVIKFQKEHGLKPDGVVGPKTQAAFLSLK